MTTITEKAVLTVRAIINAPVKKVWELWTDSFHNIHWNSASDDWHTTYVENELKTGGRFLSRMESKDGKEGFNFTGAYTKIDPLKQIEYTLDDGRKVQIAFASKENETNITETFEAEDTNSIELQQTGWQAILDNFKGYVEASDRMEPLHFSVSINAPVERVYHQMLDEQIWREWTSEFNEDSRYKGSWKKGSKILFVGTDQDGSIGGMVSKIKENIPNKFVSIEHLGIVEDCKEVMSGAKVDEWKGALENYTFTESNGITLLSIDTDANKEFKSYFLETWPKALKKLKSICERD